MHFQDRNDEDSLPFLQEWVRKLPVAVTVSRTASRHILDRFMKMVSAIKNNDSSEDFHLSFSFSMRSYVQ